jgi:hypothetical protein
MGITILLLIPVVSLLIIGFLLITAPERKELN